jgi:hypothetical protein
MQGPLWISLMTQYNYIRYRNAPVPPPLFKENIAIEDPYLYEISLAEYVNPPHNTLTRTKLELGYNITSWLGISTGLSANFLYTQGHGVYILDSPIVQDPIPSWHGDIHQNLKYWTGFQASIVIGHLGKGFFGSPS